ncbi:hypothetical protein GOP47_0015943 [Adiantum capillus-veneris]|uniref:Uncharacterized protein n=1 Tax=Adiantum capillus-veneris TaxID=13818 RepID=A0A9D4ULE9_ADICA|nr:hypothetical protein GOP47_0015943 [Adiantum capillus-veneris]
MWNPHGHAAYHDCESCGSPAAATKWALELSSLSNVVISCCAKVLATSLEDLQSELRKKALVSSKVAQKNGLSLLEYCCFKALATLTKNTNFLKDKQFRYLSFEMMIAWEAPGSVAMCFKKLQNRRNGREKMDKHDTHLSYSAVIPLLVHQKTTVGEEAFTHIVPAISGVADVLSAHFLFYALACPTGGRLPFRIYDRYLKEIDKALMNLREWTRRLNVDKSEVVVEIEGTMASGLVIQHVGASTWPGRLILTSRQLYFEPIGVTSHDMCQSWDLAADLQQVVEPYSSGSRTVLFLDRALSYKSIDDHTIFEFPGAFGCTRRDYWLMIIQEILYAHQFVRNFSLDGDGLIEAISRSIMGILRFKAVREALRANPAQPKLLLCFSMAHALPQANFLLRILGDNLTKTTHVDPKQALMIERSVGYAKPAVHTLFPTEQAPESKIGEFFLDDIPRVKKVIEQCSPLWKDANGCEIKLSREKADCLSVNIATIKAVVSSLQPVILYVNGLISWDEPYKTIFAILLGASIIMRDLLQYVACFLSMGIVCFILFFKGAGDGPLSGVVDILCPSQSTAGEVLELQQALNGLEELLKTSNITLLKTRALFFSVCPKATDQVILLMMIGAAFFTILPMKILVLLLFLEVFTRRLPLRQENSPGCIWGIEGCKWDNLWIWCSRRVCLDLNEVCPLLRY